MEIPHIEVGILFAPIIRFRLNGRYLYNGKSYQGEYIICRQNKQYLLKQQNNEE